MDCFRPLKNEVCCALCPRRSAMSNACFPSPSVGTVGGDPGPWAHVNAYQKFLLFRSFFPTPKVLLKDRSQPGKGSLSKHQQAKNMGNQTKTSCVSRAATTITTSPPVCHN